jgi:hypothetical protein
MDTLKATYKKCDISLSEFNQIDDYNWMFKYCITIHAETTDDYLKSVEVPAKSIKEAKENALKITKQVIDELLCNI